MTVDSSYFTCIPMAVFNSASLTASYQSINGTGFADDIKILKLYNTSSVPITISYDGTNDNDILPEDSGPFVINLQANHADNSSNGAGTLYGRKGQIIYGKGTAGTGNIYVIGYR